MADQILQQEAYDSYRFLIDHTNFKEGSKGYGLTLDRSNNPNSASIAGSGFMLSGLVIGVERKWDSYETNLKRAQLTLQNFYHHIPHFEGMFVHYCNFETGERYKTCEYSTIDTTLFINGMMTVDSYFDDEVIHVYAKKIYERINWNKFVFKRRGRYVFRMAYNDIVGGDYVGKQKPGWIYHWSMMAEQLSMYVLAAGSKKVKAKRAKELFLGFDRNLGGYHDYQFVHPPLGSLFIHQFSHAWFDFRLYYDLKGYDWFRNSIQATLGNYAYCQDQRINFKTFQSYLWGLSSCDGPKGYSGYGAPPFGNYESFDKPFLKLRTDGTVALYAMLASLPFCSELVKTSVKDLLSMHPEVKGDYGFYDSINLEEGNWIGKNYLSIDKGITLLMIDNYYHQTNWHYYMKHPVIQQAIQKLAFVKKEGLSWQQ